MRLIITIQLNKKYGQKSGLSSVVLLASVLLLQSFLRSRKPAKKTVFYSPARKGGAVKNCFLCFKTPHVLYPTFGVATLSVTPTPQKKRGPCYSHRHTDFQRLLNCPAIKFNRNANADFLDLFRFASLVHLPLHAHSLPAQKKGFPVCGGWSMPQHRHPLPKKRLSINYTG